MSHIDDRIRDALEEEDAELFAEYGEEQNILEAVFDSFRSKARWLIIVTMVVMLAFMVFTIWTAVRFFEVETTREMIAWAIGFVFGMGAITAMKVWYWMELNKNALKREIKRLELAVAHLAQRLH